MLKNIITTTIIFSTALILLSCKKDVDFEPLKAGFIYTLENNNIVNFTNTSTGQNIKYSWDFGDDKGISSDQNPKYQYNYNGTYSVKLIISNTSEKDSISLDLTVTNGKEFAVKAKISSLSKNSSYITFNNGSENADTFVWDFGDGTTSTEKSPKHIYEYNDDYLVKLTAINKKRNLQDTYQFYYQELEGIETKVFENNTNSTVFFVTNKTQIPNFSSYKETGGYVYAFDATNGKVKWRHFLRYSSPVTATPTFRDNGILFVGFTNNLRGFIKGMNIRTGQTLWETTTPYLSFSIPYILNNTIYSTFWSNENNYSAINYSGSNASTKFQVSHDESLLSSSPTLGSNGRVYFIGEKNYLNCYIDNKLQWRVKGVDNSVNPLVHEKKVFAGGSPYSDNNNNPIEGGFYCFNEETGGIIWKNPSINSFTQSSPTYDSEKLFVLSGKTLFALNIESGLTIWSHQFPENTIKHNNRPISSPIVSGNYVYIGVSSKLYAIEKNTGKLQWTISLGETIYASPVVADNKVYISNNIGEVFSINANTGELIWKNKMDSDNYNTFSPSVLTSDGKYFHSSINGLQN